jgi:hypothetical protein
MAADDYRNTNLSYTKSPAAAYYLMIKAIRI